METSEEENTIARQSMEQLTRVLRFPEDLANLDCLFENYQNQYTAVRQRFLQDAQDFLRNARCRFAANSIEERNCQQIDEDFDKIKRYANAVHAVEIQDIERIGVLNTLNENLENTIQAAESILSLSKQLNQLDHLLQAICISVKNTPAGSLCETYKQIARVENEVFFSRRLWNDAGCNSEEASLFNQNITQMKQIADRFSYKLQEMFEIAVDTDDDEAGETLLTEIGQIMFIEDTILEEAHKVELSETQLAFAERIEQRGCRSIITTALLSRVGEDFALILAKLEEHSPCSPPKEVKPSSSFPSTPASKQDEKMRKHLTETSANMKRVALEIQEQSDVSMPRSSSLREIPASNRNISSILQDLQHIITLIVRWNERLAYCFPEKDVLVDLFRDTVMKNTSQVLESLRSLGANTQSLSEILVIFGWLSKNEAWLESYPEIDCFARWQPLATKYFKLGGNKLRMLHKNLILSDMQSDVQRNPEGKLYSLAPIEYFRLLHQQMDVILSYGAKMLFEGCVKMLQQDIQAFITDLREMKKSLAKTKTEAHSQSSTNSVTTIEILCTEVNDYSNCTDLMVSLEDDYRKSLEQKSKAIMESPKEEIAQALSICVEELVDQVFEDQGLAKVIQELFSEAWLEGTTMKVIAATLEDYFNDLSIFLYPQGYQTVAEKCFERLVAVYTIMCIEYDGQLEDKHACQVASDAVELKEVFSGFPNSRLDDKISVLENLCELINAKSDEDVAKCYSGIQEVFPEFNQYYVDIILSKKEAKKVKRAPSAITELGSFSKVTPIKRESGFGKVAKQVGMKSALSGRDFSIAGNIFGRIRRKR